jgi:hypothetical protein
METLLSIGLGVGLSAACGFRVFVPLLVMSVAAHAGHLSLAPGFEWIGTPPAVAAFAVATCLEIAAYFVPGVDNLLDAVATPAAIVAGTVVTAAAVSEMTPLLRWALAVIAGGGAAATVQVTTAFARGASTVTTGGLGNPLVATMELGGSITLSLLAIALPLIGGIVVVSGLYLAGRRRHARQRRNASHVRPGEDRASRAT